MVTGLLSAFFALSYTSLIFGGEMAQLSPSALGYFLQGALIVGLVTALFSSLPGTIATVQDVPAAMYAVVSAAIVTRMAERATPDQIFATVVMGLVLTSAVVGLGFWALCAAKLGNLVSYVPYPVTAGFLAGVGIYLIVGAIQISTGVPVAWENATRFATLDMASLWLPTFICGLTLFWLMWRFHNPFVLPGFLLASPAGVSPDYHPAPCGNCRAWACWPWSTGRYCSYRSVESDLSLWSAASACS